MAIALIFQLSGLICSLHATTAGTATSQVSSAALTAEYAPLPSQTSWRVQPPEGASSRTKSQPKGWATKKAETMYDSARGALKAYLPTRTRWRRGGLSKMCW